MSELTPSKEPEAPRCQLCQAAVLAEQLSVVNTHRVCPSCLAQIQSEIAAQAVTLRALPMALLGGGVGAIIAAAIWAGIGISTGYEVGYVALLVGYLAGKGVVLLNGKQRGKVLQLAAVGAALGGLLLAKIAIIDYYVVLQYAKEGHTISPFSLAAIFGSIITVPATFTLFDILWVYLAVRVAWYIPKAAKLQLAAANAPQAK